MKPPSFALLGRLRRLPPALALFAFYALADLAPSRSMLRRRCLSLAAEASRAHAGEAAP